MKKRILSVLMALAVCFSSIGMVSVMAATGDLILSDTTTVNVDNTDTCFAKVTDSEYHADSNYYMHFKTEGDWLEVAQNLTEGAVAGGQYVITVVAKPVTGKVWFRVGWDDTGWLVSSQTELATELEDGWLKYVKEVTLTANQSNILFHNDGAAEMYIDSISLKPVGEDKELLLNGGFDEVAYDAETGIITANATTVNASNTDIFAKMVREELSAGNEYSLHFKATGNDWLEVSQNLTEGTVAGGKYVLTAYVKPVTGKVWFYVDWDATGWMATHAADVIAPQADGWTMVQKTITMTDGKAKLLFHNDGETEMYIDDISLVAVGGTENLVPDGGFGEVTVEGGEEPPVVEPEEPEEPTEDIPDENLTLSNTTHLNMENTDTCFAKVTDDEKSEGSYSLHFKAAASDWLEVDQTLTAGATAGAKYILSASVKVVTGKVWFRVGWDDTGWLVSTQTDLGTDVGDGWIKLAKEVTLTGDQTKLLFHNDGEAEMYIDDISLVAVGGTENLVPDGGFEDVTVNTPAEDIPDEDLTLSSTTTVNVANTDTTFAKVTDNEKAGGSYSLHFKAAAADWLEVSQSLTETAVAGGQYVFTAYIKPVTGKVWFRVCWDDTGWMVSSQEGTDAGNGWTKIEKTITLKADQPNILFHNDGEAEFYIDDISLVKVGETTNLVPDGGFEEVTIAGEEPPHEHSYEGVVTTPATHITEGVMTYTCECGETYTEAIEKTADHEWDEGVVTLEPTVDAEGIKTYTCPCGETKTETIEKLPAPVYAPGDANGDTEIDVKDVISVRRFITSSFGTGVYEKSADVTKDGMINVKDVITIRRFLAGGYGVEL